jgi:uroporphyrin-III C-methyltransferase/precorrin-2 dehydrogenase/sirohydrochlorin ferrochelatase
MPDERILLATLGTLGARIAEAGVRPPAIIVIGDVVAVARPDAFAEQ